MMPTPEQEARLKSCKSSAEYDAEWQRITNENLQTMTERTAAEIRALREQEYDLWQTNRNISIQQSKPIKTSIVRSPFMDDFNVRQGFEILEQEQALREGKNLPKVEIAQVNPIHALISFAVAIVVVVFSVLAIIRYTR